MRFKYFAVSLIILVVLAFTAAGQKVVNGNLGFLKKNMPINTEFVYDSMGVGRYNYESEYVKAKVAEHNDAVPGKGDDWLLTWNHNKEIVFPDAFIQAFNLRLKKAGVIASLNQPSAQYTMVVKTIFFEAGFSMFVSESSNINLEILFYQSDDRGHEIAKIEVGFINGTGGYPEIAYQHAGSVLGKYLYKSVYK
jgi:hypothetical protein